MSAWSDVDYLPENAKARAIRTVSESPKAIHKERRPTGEIVERRTIANLRDRLWWKAGTLANFSNGS